MLQSQFLSVFLSVRSSLDLSKLCHSTLLNGSASLINLLPDSIKCRFQLMPDLDISVRGVAKLQSNLNSTKATGPDAIRPTDLKELSQVIARAVTAIFQRSLVTSDWKKAQVSPLFKKCNKQDPANYRPISLTCILCKTMENIVALILQSISVRMTYYMTFSMAFESEGRVKHNSCS